MRIAGVPSRVTSKTRRFAGDLIAGLAKNIRDPRGVQRRCLAGEPRGQRRSDLAIAVSARATDDRAKRHGGPERGAQVASARAEAAPQPSAIATAHSAWMPSSAGRDSGASVRISGRTKTMSPTSDGIAMARNARMTSDVGFSTACLFARRFLTGRPRSGQRESTKASTRTAIQLVAATTRNTQPRRPATPRIESAT